MVLQYFDPELKGQSLWIQQRAVVWPSKSIALASEGEGPVAVLLSQIILPPSR